MQKTGELTIDEFLQGSLKMKGQGQSKDVYAVRMAITQLKETFADFEDEVEEINSKVSRLEGSMRTVFQQAEQIFRPRDAAKRKQGGFKDGPPTQDVTHGSSMDSEDEGLDSGDYWTDGMIEEEYEED